MDSSNFNPCDCGCGQNAGFYNYTSRKQGVTRGEPRRFIRGHNSWLLGNTYCVEEDRGFETPCWIWQGEQDVYGYGSCGRDSKGRNRKKAHRAYYEQRYGPIPSSVFIHHRCEVRLCCNPDHLEAVDGNKGHKIHHPSPTKLNRQQIAEVRRLYATESFSQKRLGKMFGVSQPVIWHIVNWHGAYPD